MSISLEKRAEKIGIILAKHDIVTVPPVRVGLALDVSGSAQGLYQSGVMQETVDRLLAVSLKFDDNGELDMWAFDNRHSQLETATPADYGTYIRQKLLLNEEISLWGGTSYGGVLEDMIQFWFKGKPTVQQTTRKTGGLFGLFQRDEVVEQVVASTLSPELAKLPAMGLLVTDGENSDKDYAERILTASKNHNVYWQMVGVGQAHHFEFLERMADDLPNVGFVNLESLSQTDDEIYSQLIAQEFISWVKSLGPKA